MHIEALTGDSFQRECTICSDKHVKAAPFIVFVHITFFHLAGCSQELLPSAQKRLNVELDGKPNISRSSCMRNEKVDSNDPIKCLALEQIICSTMATPPSRISLRVSKLGK